MHTDKKHQTKMQNFNEQLYLNFMIPIWSQPTLFFLPFWSFCVFFSRLFWKVVFRNQKWALSYKRLRAPALNVGVSVGVLYLPEEKVVFCVKRAKRRRKKTD